MKSNVERETTWPYLVRVMCRREVLSFVRHLEPDVTRFNPHHLVVNRKIGVVLIKHTHIYPLPKKKKSAVVIVYGFSRDIIKKINMSTWRKSNGSALSKFGVVYVMTHDSIGLGEDGPTHQPVEVMELLRSTPNMMAFRPADGNEVWSYHVLML